jgi:CrcB protein
MRILAIGVAGALGALARYGLTNGVQRYMPAGFPGGTLVVNLIGCFLLGLLASLSVERLPMGMTMRAAVLVGFLGAFTTFSTFGYETLTLLREGAVLRAALNVGLSVGVGIMACWAGVVVAARV